MNRIDFTKNGGFPATQFMTDFMQKSYREAFAALAALIGNKVVVQGMAEVGGAVTSGWISYNGELIEFIGGPLGATPFIVISEASASRLFQDGSTNDVYFTKTASIGDGAGTFPYADLKRIDTLQATFQSLADLITAFNIHAHNYDDIVGKPLYYISHKASFNIGDVNVADKTLTIDIPDQTVSDYFVLGTLIGNDNNWNNNNDIFPPIVYDKQIDSFKIALHESTSVVQNIRYEYVIIKLF